MTGMAMSIRTTSGSSDCVSVTASSPFFAPAPDDVEPVVPERIASSASAKRTVVVGDQDALPRAHFVSQNAQLGCQDVSEKADSPRQRIQRLLVTGDNRLKQGVAPEKARQSFLEALEVAREAGLEESVRPLVEVRLADLERLARESPRSDRPED